MTQVDRGIVVQHALNALGPQSTTYLEIGIRTGRTFRHVRAGLKIGVDPCLLSRRHKIVAISTRMQQFRPSRSGELIFQEESDVFFARRKRLLTRRGLSVVLVDGLHECRQAYRDVENSMRYLQPGGTIVMHDCSPSVEAAAIPDRSRAETLPNFPGYWNGDVWKALVKLRATYRDWHISVLDTDHGLGLVRRPDNELPHASLPISIADIEDLEFGDLEENRKALLNLVPVSELGRVLGTAGG